MNTTSTTPIVAAPREAMDANAASSTRQPSDKQPAADAFERVMRQQRDGRTVAGGEPTQDEDTQREDGSNDIALAALCARLMPGPSGASAAPSAATVSVSVEPSWQQVADYVERLLVEASAPRSGAPAAVFTLHADLLQDTSAALTRVDTGWLLRIQSDDQRLRSGDMKRHEDALRSRFASRGLGDLIIEHGELPFAF
jgi:hypothetical protein